MRKSYQGGVWVRALCYFGLGALLGGFPAFLLWILVSSSFELEMTLLVWWLILSAPIGLGLLFTLIGLSGKGWLLRRLLEFLGKESHW
ncbi:hypothetical protein [Roseibacillus persicicus]|uniref:hypothetical protein n=1 Tax=Roseibacillus persicicus TaxID=454148 RepID=UPI001675721B|nr:hypothetical protein [Roseibacillus persicicus]MDQ8191775.1 hypothetical protein [Roseibacillus persicicus]